MQDSFSLGILLGTLFRRARIIVVGTFLIALAAALISLFLLPRLYLSSASLMPETEQASSPLSALLGQSSLPFVGMMGGGGSAEIHREVLHSFSVCRRVVEALDLYGPYEMAALRAENPELAEQDAVTRLQESLTVEIDDRSGVLRLLVTANEAVLARDIVLALLEELDYFNREKLQEAGQRKLGFIEGRLSKAQEDLKAAQEALAAFSARQGVVHLPAEVEAQLGLVAELNRRLVMKELERSGQAMDAAGDSPALRRLDAEIAVLEVKLATLESGEGDSALRFKPLAELPKLTMAYYRLRREIEIQQEIVDLLFQQSEQARLQAENDVATIQVLDAPRVPTLPVWPRKKLIVVAAALLGFLVLCIWVLWLDFLARVRRDEGKRWGNWQWLPGSSRRQES